MHVVWIFLQKHDEGNNPKEKYIFPKNDQSSKYGTKHG